MKKSYALYQTKLFGFSYKKILQEGVGDFRNRKIALRNKWTAHYKECHRLPIPECIPRKKTSENHWQDLPKYLLSQKKTSKESPRGIPTGPIFGGDCGKITEISPRKISERNLRIITTRILENNYEKKH